MRKVLAVAMALAFSGCGGDDESRATSVLEAAAAPQRMRALAVPVGADADANADRLMDFAEEKYKEYFPAHEATRKLNGWTYRYYAQTGVFLAVINWRVFVVGGPFGAEVRDVGEVSDFISVVSPSNQAPTIGLSLAAGAAPATPTVVMTAEASDSDGTVSKVEFFNGTTKLGEVTAAPFVYTWTNVPVGLHVVKATATDNSGAATSVTSSVLNLTAGIVVPPASAISVATLAKCPTSLGSSDANAYKCLVGSTPIGTQSTDVTKACSMSISEEGVIAVTSEGQTYSVTAPQLAAADRHFTRTSSGLSFDYGSTATSLSAVRIKVRTEDKVYGQFFQQGGGLVIEVTRTSPVVDLRCTIPLALT